MTDVRLVRSEEYDAVADLLAGVYLGDGHVTEDREYVSELRDTAGRAAGADVLVATSASGELLGTVTSCPAGSAYREVAGPDEGEFRMLAVRSEARGQGVGERLVRHCLDRSRSTGDRAMALCTMTDMTAARRIYDRLGFVRTPARDWTPVPGIDLLAYRLEYEAITEG